MVSFHEKNRVCSNWCYLFDPAISIRTQKTIIFYFSGDVKLIGDLMKKTYTIVVEKGLDGYYVGEVPELPGCYSQAKTTKELMTNIKEAIELYLESVKDLKDKPRNSFVGFREVVVNA